MVLTLLKSIWNGKTTQLTGVTGVVGIWTRNPLFRHLVVLNIHNIIFVSHHNSKIRITKHSMHINYTFHISPPLPTCPAQPGVWTVVTQLQPSWCFQCAHSEVISNQRYTDTIQSLKYVPRQTVDTELALTIQKPWCCGLELKSSGAHLMEQKYKGSRNWYPLISK